MTNQIIAPIFATEADRLTFLSRLWGVTITDQDTLDWEAYKLTRPSKLVAESETEYSERTRLWREGRVLRQTHYILAKYEGYALGKIKAAAATYLDTKPAPNRTQAREAVRLQLSTKWATQVAESGVDVAADLLPLVTGIVW